MTFNIELRSFTMQFSIVLLSVFITALITEPSLSFLLDQPIIVNKLKCPLYLCQLKCKWYIMNNSCSTCECIQWSSCQYFIQSRHTSKFSSQRYERTYRISYCSYTSDILINDPNIKMIFILFSLHSYFFFSWRE